MNSSPTTRINISLSEDVLIMLRHYVPERGLSRFLTDAALEKVEKIKREKAFKELLSVTATFTHVHNASAYVHRSRSLDEKRTKRLGI